MSAVRAILFDLGRVLCHVDLAPMRAAWESGTGMAASRLDEALFERGIKDALDTGRITPAAAAEALTAETGVPVSLDAFRAIWVQALSPWNAMNDLALGLCRRVPCGLLSNTDPIHHAHAREHYSALRAMRTHTVSYQVGACKPNPAIYAAAAASLGVDPTGILFVDDLEENVEAARAMGFRGHRFTAIGGLVADLVELGLNPFPEVPR